MSLVSNNSQILSHGRIAVNLAIPNVQYLRFFQAKQEDDWLPDPVDRHPRNIIDIDVNRLNEAQRFDPVPGMFDPGLEIDFWFPLQ